MLLRVRVSYQKMLCGGACSRNFFDKENDNWCRNNSVEKIIGRLVIQKTVCARKGFDTEKLKDRNCVKTEGLWLKKNCFCISLSKKNVVDEKCCLENL